MKRLSALVSVLAIAGGVVFGDSATATNTCLFGGKNKGVDSISTTSPGSFWNRINPLKSDRNIAGFAAGATGLAIAGGVFYVRRRTVATSEHPEAPGGSFDVGDEGAIESAPVEAETAGEREAVLMK